MLAEEGWMTGANPQQRRHCVDFFSYPLSPILSMLQTSSLAYCAVVHALSYIDPLQVIEKYKILYMNSYLRCSHTLTICTCTIYIHQQRIVYVRMRGMHTVKFASNK
jgi:hypothetical protein